MLHFQPHPQKDHRAPLVSDFLNLTGEKKKKKCHSTVKPNRDEFSALSLTALQHVLIWD